METKSQVAGGVLPAEIPGLEDLRRRPHRGLGARCLLFCTSGRGLELSTKVAGFVQRSVRLSRIFLHSLLSHYPGGGASLDFFFFPPTLASSSVLFCFFKPLCPAPIRESAVYVQGPLKRQLTAPWLRSSLLVSPATGGRENRTCQMENVS